MVSVRRLAVSAVVFASALAVAPVSGAAASLPVLAVPDCPGNRAPRTLVTLGGVFESVVADPAGRLLVSDVIGRRIAVLDSPGAALRTLVADVDPGGLALGADGRIIAGVGAIPLIGQPALIKVDPDTGATEPFASGLSGANGVAVLADGTAFTSTGELPPVDRIAPDGTVTKAWTSVWSANGLVADSAEQYLYASQTLSTGVISRVDIATGQVSEYVRAPLLDVLAGLDGLTRDSSDRLYAAAYLGGAVWRVSANRSICALARGLPTVAMVAIGAGGDFPTTSLYAVTHTGFIVELPNAIR